jgi:hypothetical protein
MMIMMLNENIFNYDLWTQKGYNKIVSKVNKTDGVEWVLILYRIIENQEG